MTEPTLIAVDWGTSAMRAALLASDGTVIEDRAGGPGILAVTSGGFDAILSAHIASWQTTRVPLPILLSGMIGSRQGWIEVPYLQCPATVAQLAKALYPMPASARGPVHIVPGLSINTNNASGMAPDVMRGEETQIAGALQWSGATDGVFVLPGTHSKWVTVTNGSITHFATYMTGEIFAALRHHTILGRLMPDGGDQTDPAAFRSGVVAGAADGPPGALLQRVFATRTLGLFDQRPAASLSSYLSGLLIGSEMSAALECFREKCVPFSRQEARQNKELGSFLGSNESETTQANSLLNRSFTIVGSAPALTELYRTAASSLELDARIAPPDCAARGAFVLARAAGLVGHAAP